MALYAVNSEGAEALRGLAKTIYMQANGIIDASDALNAAVTHYYDDLGIYGDRIRELTQAAKQTLNSRRDAVELLAKKLLDRAKCIDELVARGLAASPGAAVVSARGSGETRGGSSGAVSGGTDKVYIEGKINELREYLLGHGVTSVFAINKAVSSLKEFYYEEPTKGGAAADIDFERFLKEAKENLPPIAGVFPGEPMTFEDADSHKVNPNYGKGDGYSENCQTDVVVFIARQRGYNVEALPCVKGSVLEKLAYNSNLAWIDPRTGKHPEYIYDQSIKTPEKLLEFLDKKIEPGKSYTFEFTWRNLSGGHIVNIDRNEYGDLRIKDNQRGIGETDMIVGNKDILEYISKIQYPSFLTFSINRELAPKLLRVDNMDFDHTIVDHIMKGAGT